MGTPSMQVKGVYQKLSDPEQYTGVSRYKAEEVLTQQRVKAEVHAGLRLRHYAERLQRRPSPAFTHFAATVCASQAHAAAAKTSSRTPPSPRSPRSVPHRPWSTRQRAQSSHGTAPRGPGRGASVTRRSRSVPVVVRPRATPRPT